MGNKNILNIYSKSEDWRGRTLSNFSHHPFVLDGLCFESVEGFIQGIAFPEEDPRRKEAFHSFGKEAKAFEKQQEKHFVWWAGKKIKFGSPKEHKLVERAIRAKFEQNPGAKKALMATDGLTLTHVLPEPEPPRISLPTKVFCGILTKIRTGYLAKKQT